MKVRIKRNGKSDIEAFVVEKYAYIDQLVLNEKNNGSYIVDLHVRYKNIRVDISPTSGRRYQDIFPDAITEGELPENSALVPISAGGQGDYNDSSTISIPNITLNNIVTNKREGNPIQYIDKLVLKDIKIGSGDRNPEYATALINTYLYTNVEIEDPNIGINDVDYMSRESILTAKVRRITEDGQTKYKLMSPARYNGFLVFVYRDKSKHQIQTNIPVGKAIFSSKNDDVTGSILMRYTTRFLEV